MVGTTPAVYEAVNEFPKASLVASLDRAVNDNIPAFTQRSVLVCREFSLPFHVDFNGEMRQRATDLLTAQYSSEMTAVKSFVEKYGVGVWILSNDFLVPDYLSQYDWLVNSLMNEDVMNVRIDLERGEKVAISGVIPFCSVERTGEYTVLDAECILRQ